MNEQHESISTHTTYVLDRKLDCQETNMIEFKSFGIVKYNKEFRKDFLYMIEKYLNGFVNMNGGSIYIGITDHAQVKGIDFIDDKELDKIRQLLPDKLKKWNPEKYTRSLLQSLKIEIKNIVCIDNTENCGYMLPTKKGIPYQYITY